MNAFECSLEVGVVDVGKHQLAVTASHFQILCRKAAKNTSIPHQYSNKSCLVPQIRLQSRRLTPLPSF